jgi:methyl-accepting chemotaxis protein
LLHFLERKSRQSTQAQAAAISRSQAIIEFKLDGTIVTANENFLTTLGYSLDEIRGKHHSMFVEPAARDGAGYREFWAKLGNGEFQAAQYRRIGKGGREIWIQASYNPVLDTRGSPPASSSLQPTSRPRKSAAWRRMARSPRSIAHRR